MTPAEWMAAGQLAVATGGVILVWQGLAQMRRAGDLREKREDVRHTEAMTALQALVQGLERQGAALERQGAALERQSAALEAALRTGGRT